MGAGDWVAGGLRRAVTEFRTALPGGSGPVEGPSTKAASVTEDASSTQLPSADHAAADTSGRASAKRATVNTSSTALATESGNARAKRATAKTSGNASAKPATAKTSGPATAKTSGPAPAKESGKAPAKPATAKTSGPAPAKESSHAPAKRAVTATRAGTTPATESGPASAEDVSPEPASPEERPGGTAEQKAPTAAPTSPTAPAWTDGELVGFRAALDADVVRLREEVHMGRADLDSLLADAERAGDDQADAGSKTLEREQEMSVNANAHELLEQSMHALARLDAGTYGICESCRTSIPAARLRAFPRATLCIPCKQAEERR